QFWIFLTGVAGGDLGTSVRTTRPVVDDLARFFPATLELAFAAIVVAAVLGVAAGVLSAVYRNPWIDATVTFVSLLGVSIAGFWFGLLSSLLFSVNLGEVAAAARGGAAHVGLPAVMLSTASLAIFARMTRSSLLETFGQDYVRPASAKGLNDRAVVLKHAL